MYLAYFNAMKSYFESIEKEKDSRELIQRKTEEERFQKKTKRILEEIFETIIDMKKQKIQEQTLTIQEQTYSIELNKRAITVTKKPNDVYLKCAWVEEKPIVFLKGESQDPENFNRVLDFYHDFMAKKTENRG